MTRSNFKFMVSPDLQRLHAHWDHEPRRLVCSPAFRRFRPAEAGTTYRCTGRIPRNLSRFEPLNFCASQRRAPERASVIRREMKFTERSIVTSEILPGLA